MNIGSLRIVKRGNEIFKKKDKREKKIERQRQKGIRLINKKERKKLIKKIGEERKMKKQKK